MWEKTTDTEKLRKHYIPDGRFGGVLLEDSITNHVKYSLSPQNWKQVHTSTSESNVVNSFFEGENAYEVYGTSGTSRLDGDAGTFTSDSETAAIMLEQGTDAKARVRIRDETSGYYYVGLEYDWSADNLTTTHGSSNLHFAKKYRIEKGPNESPSVMLLYQYGGATPGNSRGLWVMPSDDKTVIVHGGQVSQSRNFGSFIKTDSTASTIGGDIITVWNGKPQPSWWNDVQGTVYVEFIFTSGRKNIGRFLGYSASERLITRYGSVDSRNNRADPRNVNNTPGALNKVATSMTRNEMRHAQNGAVDTDDHSGSMLDAEKMLFNGGSSLTVKSFQYSPVAASVNQIKELTI